MRLLLGSVCWRGGGGAAHPGRHRLQVPGVRPAAQRRPRHRPRGGAHGDAPHDQQARHGYAEKYFELS